jgi:hypothetical protein
MVLKRKERHTLLDIAIDGLKDESLAGPSAPEPARTRRCRPVIVVDQDAHEAMISEEILPYGHGANRLSARRRIDRVHEQSVRPPRL